MKLLTILFVGITLAGCQNLWSGKHRRNADMLQLYTVERSPTHPDQQSAENNYILDFAILEPIDLSPDEAAALYAALEDGENFSTENTKRCPFIGQYAVEVAGEFAAVISSSPCSKIQLKTEEEESTRHLELVEGSTIELICAGIVQ